MPKLDHRLTKLERHGRATPYVAYVRDGETDDEAIARHRTETGHASAVILVPGGDSPMTDDEWLARFAPEKNS
ncbi:MAG: hypothetical protein ACMVY4_12315 [Minwuia sp.]|uniref:hypothetical protein n=1 Tax=Minwuia sp. TaxID=2493630 RepID=UPI003A860820